MFFTRFVISLLVSSFTVLVILLIKKGFQKQLSAKWHYNIWFLLLVSLTFPFLSNHFFRLGNAFIPFPIEQTHAIISETAGTENHGFGNANWLQDFTISVNRSSSELLSVLIGGILVAGMMALAALVLRAFFQIRQIKRSAYCLSNEEVHSLFEQCKRDLRITRHLNLRVSPLIESPMTFGLIKTYIVLPIQLEKQVSIMEIKYILLHELNHYKNHDILTNYLICIYQLLYWFNPLVWLAFRKMRLDREIACDIAVLKTLDEAGYVEYGNVILDFAERSPRSSRRFALASDLASSSQQLKKRIEKIASYTAESNLLKMKSIAVFILVGAVVLSQIPFLSVMAAETNHYNFNGERTIYEDLSKYFGGFEGSFVLYDSQADQYSIYNPDKSETRISPDSTYKIYSLLFGLESNAITSTNSTVDWDGTLYPYDAWNKDQNLLSAMKNSVNWYFQELDNRTGRERLQAFFDQIGYGNCNLSGKLSTYWLESSLKISPIEQVQVLKAFYTNQFGFHEANIQTAKNALLLSNHEGTLLSGKTGTGTVNGKNVNGWFVGYVEVKGKTYFFATNIQNKDYASGSTAAKITMSILKDKSIVPH